MVQINPQEQAISRPRPQKLFYPQEPPVSTFPIQAVEIDWDRLIAKRPVVLEIIDAMPVYLLKPEVLALLEATEIYTNVLTIDGGHFLEGVDFH